jgi:hypothetical protein
MVVCFTGRDVLKREGGVDLLAYWPSYSACIARSLCELCDVEQFHGGEGRPRLH